eukprot:TRINITY_DN13768_c1_g1_i1.p1 TRINITY_DN13768_c1_g1~~TRINITY_DN13768_c1_g1_i1.p1  ORF type:complete len:127 (-),score=20.52 TRINITY_DN13768_c1_g1_i1:45-383(-)
MRSRDSTQSTLRVIPFEANINFSDDISMGFGSVSVPLPSVLPVSYSMPDSQFFYMTDSKDVLSIYSNITTESSIQFNHQLIINNGVINLAIVEGSSDASALEPLLKMSTSVV